MSYFKRVVTQRVVSADGQTVAEVTSEVTTSIDTDSHVHQSIHVRTVSTSHSNASTKNSKAAN